ncbi:MAG: sulfatase-like hydrolase/transferase [Lachnospiraceae bacterium]
MSIRRRRRGGDSNIFNSDKRQRMKRIKQEQRQKSGGKGVNTWTPLHYAAYYVILPMVLIFVIEMMGYKSLLGGFRFIIKHPWPYVVNVLMIATSFCLSLFFRKRRPVIMIFTVLWSICGIANFILLLNRVTPLTGNDLKLISDLFGVIAKYLNGIQVVLMVILLVIVFGIIVWAFMTWQPDVKKVSPLRALVITAAMIAVTWGAMLIGWKTGTLETQFPELSASYKKNGVIYCFTNSLVDVGIRKPANYSAEEIEKQTSTESASKAENGEKENDKENGKETEAVKREGPSPNIVIVQLETFFDVNRLKDFRFSINPIPNFTALSEQWPSGLFSVPVIGAGTVNTEFEVLTGMNMDDFGAGEYPFKTILTETTMESIAYNLAAQGYATHALHNHTGSFYGRNKVYANLGFNTFTSVEYMYPRNYTYMGWAKDKVLTGEIEKVLDSTEGPDLAYTVSVQGHGSYPSEPAAVYSRHVMAFSDTITDEGYMNQVQYYVNQLFEMDEFIKELVDMLEARDEDCILLMYGDHLPSLNLEDEDLSRGTTFQTNYFIWNNMGLEFDGGNIEAYDVNSMLLGAINVKDGVINAYHQSAKAKMKGFTMNQEQYLEGLKQLEYDILYGEKLCYNGQNPYSPTVLQMGIDPISVSEVYESADGGVIVRGKNFTSYSIVVIDGENQKTQFVDKDMLKVEGVDLWDGAEVKVMQKTLSQTNTLTYHEETTSSEGGGSSESETEAKAGN